ncbi:MAG: 2-oxoglutarate dehydrogenase complex dihydrolipoyllysine-residue succinyltransferase [Pseudomonadota bacterium]
MAVEITVPAAGESVSEADIGEWLKAEGDFVNADEPVVTLETDKASMDVPAPAAGVLKALKAKEGDTVSVGDVIAIIEEGEGASANGGASGGSKAAEKPSSSSAREPASADGEEGEEIEVTVPASGESVTEADIGEWLKKEGDQVAADEPIVTLETDKASMDVPAPAAGVLKTQKAKEGDTVSVGDVIAVIAAGATAEAKTNGAAPARAEQKTEAKAPSSEKPLSPAPRRVIEEHDLDPSNIKGTGKDGRITKGDALAAIEARSKQPAKQEARAPREAGAREERVKMTRLRQTIARRLKQAQEDAAMLTTFNDVDMTAVMDLRKQYKEVFEKKHGVKLGFMGFFVKACVHALREIPDVNAEIDGDHIIYKDHYDIGIAVGTDKGLVVPVLRDADEKSLATIEKDIVDYGKRARDGKLSIEEMQGGTFTITNGGVYGSLMSTPILNPPQSGVLGMHRIEQRPVVVDGQVVVRPMMYLALSYDHRIVDGKGAVTFLVRVKENLEDPQRLLLDL